MSLINSKIEKISVVLSGDRYYIPEYQRGYSWENAQLEDFWLDLYELSQEEDREIHFLGQIVIHEDKKEKKKYVIDGQQRLTTSVILLDIIRTKLNQLHREHDIEDANIDAGNITSTLIGTYTERRDYLKLVLGRIDKEFFKKTIQKTGPIKYNNPDLNKKKIPISNFNIINASKFFNDKIDSFLEKITDPERKYEYLIDLSDTFGNNFKVMYLETDDINEAYIIFETLNARGRELETSDLLKNHLLRSSQDKLDSISNKWYKMIDNLGEVDPTKFIRHYWNSKHQFTTEKSLFNKLRKSIDTPKKVEEVMEELVFLSELYAALQNPNENKYYEGAEINERIFEIKKLKAMSFYPIMLALENEKFDEKEINEILIYIESLIVRNLVVASKVANVYEKEFSKIAREISEHILIDKSEIIKKINALIISDEEFYDTFKIFTSKNTDVVRYILRKLHNHLNYETRVISDNNTVHIEHILPKRPKVGEWNEFIEEDKSEFLWRIGNLTLLGNEYNKRATNSDFTRKKEIYNKSKIPMTKSLIDYKNWDIESILNRQKYFAEIAPRVWKKI